MKKSKSKARSRFVFTQKLNLQLAFFVFLALFIGGVIGYLLNNHHDERYSVASRSTISSIKKELTAQYQSEYTSNCTEGSSQERKDVFQKYLKVNKYGNRAVMRGCADVDTLVAKNPITNKWEQTVVNVSLDRRANANWQIECMIDDITTADDVTRPENSSIDTTNYVACRQLKEREQIVSILLSSGAYKQSEISQDDVNEYIKGAEDFSRL